MRILFAFLAAQTLWAQYPVKIDLNGEWDYRPVACTVLKPDQSIATAPCQLPPPGKMKIPTNWHLAALKDFNGRVVFSRDFTLSPLNDGEHAWIVFQGVDYYTRVLVNGAEAGRHEGYFQSFEFDLTPHVKRGTNRIEVEVDSPLEEPEAVFSRNKLLIKGILTDWDGKPAGQDGNTGGIWNSVYIEIRPSVWLGAIKLTTSLAPERIERQNNKSVPVGQAPKVRASIQIPALRNGTYKLVAQLGDTRVEKQISVVAPGGPEDLLLTVRNPKRWWVWDLGEPYLYTFRAELRDGDRVVYHTEFPYGLREIQVNPQNGEFRLNGKRFFVRGTNIVPTLWFSEYSPSMIAGDIKLLKDAHMNGVRVCVHVNRQEFYEAMDHAGILVWQDFPLQWTYSQTDSFLIGAARQIKDMVRQFYNHASIALWVCQNEPNPLNRQVLDPFLARAAIEEDASRYVRPASEFSEHTYPGWLSGQMSGYLHPTASPFLTEYGTESLPPAATVRKMAGGDQWPLDYKKLEYYNLQVKPMLEISKVKIGNNLEEFVENSQIYQADVLKLATEMYRLQKYVMIGGMFQFMFVDSWPSITWSVVTYDRTPKRGYYAMAKAYQPVLVGTTLADTAFPLELSRGSTSQAIRFRPWIINDLQRELKNVKISATIEGAGKTFALDPVTTDVPLDGVATAKDMVFQVPEGMPPGEYRLEFCAVENGELLSANDYGITFVR